MIMSRRLALSVVCVLWAVESGVKAQPASQQAPGTPPATLPGGASQIQETHGDWRVNCQRTKEVTCVVAQQQADKDTRQLVLGTELKALSTEKAEGTLVLPFGLAVSQPVTLQVDESPGTKLTFRTCVPVGCLVPLTFEGAALSALRKGTVLAVKANASDGVQEAGFRISLNGLSGALERALALGK
jgi:invasion protein IalB